GLAVRRRLQRRMTPMTKPQHKRINRENRARMLISCPDGPGIVAAVSRFLHEHGANIVQSDQYTMDPDGGMFFIRIELDLEGLAKRLPRLEAEFAATAEAFNMSWKIYRADVKKRLAVFVSREDHCLLELLWQWQAGDLDAEIAMVISNHPHMKDLAASFGIPYYHVPVTPETKREAEAKQLELMAGKVAAGILARYMQIISPDMIAKYPNRIINIHH